MVQKRLNTKSRSSAKKRGILLLLLLLMLFLLLWIIFNRRAVPGYQQIEFSEADSVQVSADSSEQAIDTVPVQEDTVKPESRDTIPKRSSQRQDRALAKKDTIKDTVVVTAPASDSTGDSSDTTVEQANEPCQGDSAELWIYPDPSGGLHRRAIKVVLSANRASTIRWRLSQEAPWSVYDGNPLSIDSTVTLYFDGVDSCGRRMEMREEYYEIQKLSGKSPCPADMEHIKIGSAEFCIDRYEWPNRKGVVPLSYISLYHAMDSCYSVGKRLCSSEEWLLACSGPQSSTYPYGQMYERYACATHDTTVQASGSKPECRGYFGVYDMSGSLMEWTSTKAGENGQFYYVMGGFWASGPQSRCSDKRYSYYPQNRHNPVGFRCCQDLPDPAVPETQQIKKRSNR